MAGKQIKDLTTKFPLLTDLIPIQSHNSDAGSTTLQVISDMIIGSAGIYFNYPDLTIELIGRNDFGTVGNFRIKDIKGILTGGINSIVNATGSTINDAIELTTLLTQLNSTGQGQGVKLPLSHNSGDEFYVWNTSANNIMIYSQDSYPFFVEPSSPATSFQMVHGSGSGSTLYQFKFINNAGWLTLKLK